MSSECDLSEGLWDFVEEKRGTFVSNITTVGKPLQIQSREHLINSILSRRLLSYDRKDLANRFLMCVCLRRRKTLHEFSMFEPHWHLKLGEEKLMRELDVVRLLKSLRDIRLLKQVQLSEGD